MIPGLIFIILIFSFLLIKSTDWVIVAIRRIARQTHTGIFALSAIILALGTSFPELFVGVTSALEGTPSVSLGDVTGSNIANIALVGGLASLFTGRIRVRGEYLRRDVLVSMIAGIIPLLLLLDRSLNTVDGLILWAVYLAYATSFFRRRFVQIGREQQEEESFIYKFMRRFNDISISKQKRREFGRFFVGIALMLFSADMIVRFATQLAGLAKVPEFVIGLLIVAIGTSLPELVFSFRSLEDHEPSMFFGNLLGSTIANSTLVIGTTAIIHPITLVAPNKYLVAVGTFIVVFSTFWFFIRSKHRLDRWEAFMLLLLYLSFVIVEIT
jgi:cation:H+ antiporter